MRDWLRGWSASRRLWAALAGLLAVAILGSLIYFKVPSDLQWHAKFIQVSNREFVWPAEFLLFVIVGALSGLSQNLRLIEAVLVVVVTVSVVAKYVVSVRVAEFELSQLAFADGESSSQVSRSHLHLVFFLLLLAFSLPLQSWSGWLYIGQFPPNVWHNSTTIFVMPLVVLLFWQSYRSLLDPSWRNMGLVLLLSALNLAAKPSFVICVGIVFPLFALVRYRFGAPFWRVVSVMAVTFFLLLAQALYTFNSSATDVLFPGRETAAGVKIDPFNVWSYFSDSIPLSLLASFLFPVVVFLAYRRKASEWYLYRYAWALSAAGLLVYIMISETGRREFHANFSWQVIMSMYTLFLVSAILMLHEMSSRSRWGWKEWLVGGTFMLHVASGIAYVLRYLIVEDFL
jgi:hypothetical protein